MLLGGMASPVLLFFPRRGFSHSLFLSIRNFPAFNAVCFYLLFCPLFDYDDIAIICWTSQSFPTISHNLKSYVFHWAQISYAKKYGLGTEIALNREALAAS